MFRKILVVDDEPYIQTELVEFLENMGFQAQGVNNGLEAIRVFEKEPIDLLITDLKMPGISGIELIRLIRDKHPDIPIVCVTGFSSPANMNEAIDAGATDAICKPINPDKLKKILARLCGLAED